MPRPRPAVTPASFTTFGELLRYLRRRAQLTQRELGIATGYSEGQICRLEQNRRLPDRTALIALFVPTLDLDHQEDWVARLLELATVARIEPKSQTQTEPDANGQLPLIEPVEGLESIPLPTPYEIARPHALTQLWARLTAERHVALSGLAGVGKTTLAAALARQYVATAPVFWLTLTAGVTTSVDVLVHQLALFLHNHGQDQLISLVQPAADIANLPPFSQQIALLASALTRLADSYQELPLLCLDNVDLVQHDEAIAQMLRHLMATSPLALLLTSRENISLAGLVQVRLAGLERQEGLALIEQLVAPGSTENKKFEWPAGRRPPHAAGPVLSSAHLESLLNKTGGNPMLLRLALGQLLDHQAPVDPATFIAHLETESQVSSYLLETVQRRLSPAAWQLLSLIAVFRQPVDLYDDSLVELIQKADGAYNLAGALLELQRCHLIDRPTQADLHPLVRDYVYATLVADPPRRRRLHLIAAEWLEQALGKPVEAAFHYLRAGRLETVGDILVDQAETIINRGRRLAALVVVDEALIQVRRKRGNTADRLRRLLTIRGDLLLGTLQAAEAEASYREALALPAPPVVRAHVAWRLAQSLSQRGQAAEAVQLCQETAAAIAPSDTLLLARLASVECHAFLVLSRFQEAIAVGNTALSLADQLARLTPHLADEIRARTYNTLSNIYYFQRTYQTAIEHARQLIDTAGRAGLRALQYTGFGLLGGLMIEYVGQLELALFYLDQAEAGFEELGYSHGLGSFLGYKAIAYYLGHEPELAERTFARVEHILRQVGDLEGVATYQTDRGLFLLESGRVAEARTLADRLLAEAVDHQACWHTVYTMYLLGQVQLVQGETEQAIATLRQGLTLPGIDTDPSVNADIHSALALALLIAGDEVGVQQILDEAPLDDMGIWTELNHRLVLGAIALAQGDTSAVAAIAAKVTEQANAAGFRVHSRRAARLAAAVNRPPPLHRLPRLLWVMEE